MICDQPSELSNAYDFFNEIYVIMSNFEMLFAGRLVIGGPSE